MSSSVNTNSKHIPQNNSWPSTLPCLPINNYVFRIYSFPAVNHFLEGMAHINTISKLLTDTINKSIYNNNNKKRWHYHKGKHSEVRKYKNTILAISEDTTNMALAPWQRRNIRYDWKYFGFFFSSFMSA